MIFTPRHTRGRRALPPSPGRRARRGLVTAIRAAGRVLRGLVAAAALLALTAGVPWALWHYIGWPLPDHVPTWIELQVVLFSPITAGFVLDVIACACWIWWAVFTLDVLGCIVDLARCGIDAVRTGEFSAPGPTRALAGALVGSILVTVLGTRPVLASSAPLSATHGTATPVVATAPAWHHPAPGTQALEARSPVTPDGGAGAAPARPESVTVLAPHNGVHDSLWRIAQRTLGDGTRWPEIFELNKGKPQPNGHTLTQPSLIFPGEELALPRNAQPPTQPQTDADPTPPAPPPTSSAPSTSLQPPAPAPSTSQTPPSASSLTPAPQATGEPGFRWGTELFVSLGLAAAISATLLLARRRARIRYRPGSGDRDDLPVAPVVYQLRLAHLRTEAQHDLDLDAADERDDEHRQRPRRAPAAPPVVVGASGTGRPGGASVLTPGVGVRDGREIALDLAAARGLGLVGAGAPAAARALLITALTTSPGHPATSAGTSVIVPADDLICLFEHPAPRSELPSTVRVVPDLDSALNAVEAEILVRATTSHTSGTKPEVWPPLVLLAQPPAQHQRLQAVLDTGAQFGVTGLLLGQWQPGITCYVRADGTISATSPGLGEALRGTQVFRLGSDDTAQLLTLLHHAEPQPDPPDTSYLADLLPAPRTRDTTTPPAHTTHTAPNMEDPAEISRRSTNDVALEEAVAAATQPAPCDTRLEILGPDPAQDPPVRRQTPDRATAAGAQRQHPQASTTTDDPAPTDEHTGPAADAPRAFAIHHEDDTDTAQVTVTVLGGLRVHWHPEPHSTSGSREITGALQPRTQELLVLLALHPDGASRDALVTALWGQDPPARPTNALHTALARMRTTLATATGGAVTDIVSTSNGRYQLDPALVRVDYRRFARAVAARRAATTDHARINALWDVVNAYGGTLAEDLCTEWIEPVREAIRRDAVDAVAALARALVDTDPQQTLDLLEVARAFDPHNEPLYRDIMRLQERLGQLDAIPRTLNLLTTRLAEIDAQPTPHARELADRLRQRHDSRPASRAHPARAYLDTMRPAEAAEPPW